MPYLKHRTSAAKKKIKDPSWRQPTSPSRRREPWITITIRAAVYAMLRELSEHNNVSVGEVVRVMTEEEFRKTLWKIQQEQVNEARAARGEVAHDKA